jgi:hypothetical protein
MDAVIRGSADVRCAPLTSLEASSTEGLHVAAWAAKPARLARMDRLCALALVACDAALVDARLVPGGADWQAERTGIVLGTAYGCHATNEAYYRGLLARGADGASPRLFAYTLPSSPVGEISIHHHILGPASTQVAGLVAALDALAEATRHLAQGRVDRVLVAAVDVMTPLGAHLGAHGEDAAAALVIEHGSGALRIGPVVRRFIADDPQAAALSAMAAVAKTKTIYAPAALHAALADRGARLHALDEAMLSAAPLSALRAALGAGHSALVIATDPSGLAAAATLAT